MCTHLHIWLAQTKRTAARTNPKTGRSESKAQKVTERITNCCFVFNGQYTMRIKKRKAHMIIHGKWSQVVASATESPASEVGRLTPCQFLKELMESKCRSSSINTAGGFNSHDMTWLYHPASAIKYWNSWIDLNKHICYLRENQKFRDFSTQSPRSASGGWKSHPSLPSDASKGDLQRRRIGLLGPVWADVQIEHRPWYHVEILSGRWLRNVPKKLEETEVFN